VTRQNSLTGKSPRLLVSVRNATECLAALEGGADIIDIKEPRFGSLGKAEDATIRAIAETLDRHAQDICLTAALGELSDWSPDSRPQLPSRLDYVKLGFSGLRDDSNWPIRWQDFRRRVQVLDSPPPGWVAVIYADWEAASAPTPEAILAAVAELECAAVLVDTFQKNGRSLLDVRSRSELQAIADAVHALGLPLAVAGALGTADLTRVQSLNPQIVAIRSAACRAGFRDGPVCSAAVAEFRAQMRSAFQSSPVTGR